MIEKILVVFNLAFLVGCAALLVLGIQGCAVPALTGLKSYQSSDGTRYEFITGVDFGFGMNGIDTVKDSKGINPKELK